MGPERETNTLSHRAYPETRPLVSICIPTFNAARWIRDCLQSALAQSYSLFEVVIVDDASTDGTVEEVRSIKDERIRLFVNEKNLGLVHNWNRCIELAQGEFIKFLFQDDILYVDCLKKMMQLFLSDENLGFVFAPRDVIVEGDTRARETEAWLDNCRTLHTKFERLRQVNSGRELFSQYLRGGFEGNWIGEPSSVLIKMECFRRLGKFNSRLHQLCDMEMWLRIMFFYDVGFVPERLSAFRFHSSSASLANIRSRKNRFDQLRLLEGLLAHDEISSAHPEIRKMYRRELGRTFVRQIVPLNVRQKIRKHLRIA